MAIVKVRCSHCNKKMRNDGTEKNPVWVCNNPACKQYKPPATEAKSSE